MLSLSESETLALLPLRPVMDVLDQVLEDYGRGAIVSPQRLAMPCGPGDGGVLLSMPCRAPDL
ncbi:MAG: delta(1)-pyrroline-2-carboxylate reductase family protein, partial [Gluconacetobacter diazotrophicus]|nr:delta(1)-pyrroline-2-carboxylate reductase family protein [Gluconacetobacter diazotrophicus]